MGLLSFFFGKAPKINFTREGRTSHDLEQKKWDDWNDRFRKNPDYDFKKHAGTKGVTSDKSTGVNKAALPIKN